MADAGDKLFEKARIAVTVDQVAGVEKLYREGASYRGPCPLCGASAKSETGGAFIVDGSLTRWKCFSCSPRWSDVIDLEHKLHSAGGESLRHAAMRLLGVQDLSAEDIRKREAIIARRLQRSAERARRAKLFKARIALALWRDGLPAAGTPVETYLRSRGFFGWALEEALKMARYHPAAYYDGDPRKPVVAPAMILLRMTPAGPTGGVHVTYLTESGAKTALRPARKCWGPPSRIDENGIAQPGVVWITPPSAEGPLIVGEGFETTLAAMCMIGVRARGVATLSLDQLQGGWLTDGRGRTDLSALQADPMNPGFTWPEPPDKPWGAPIICLDRDMSPIKLRSAGEDDVDVEEELSADDRATLCAALSAAAWIMSGAGWIMFAVPPPAMDINDQLLAIQAGHLRPGLRVLPLQQLGDLTIQPPAATPS